MQEIAPVRSPKHALTDPLMLYIALLLERAAYIRVGIFVKQQLSDPLFKQHQPDKFWIAFGREYLHDQHNTTRTLPVQGLCLPRDILKDPNKSQ